MSDCLPVLGNLLATGNLGALQVDAMPYLLGLLSGVVVSLGIIVHELRDFAPARTGKQDRDRAGAVRSTNENPGK
jgi:hypothetical protein